MYRSILCLSLVWAQVDPKADNLIRSSRKKLKAMDHMTVVFSYMVENRADTTQKRIARSGTFRYRPKQNKFSVDIGDIVVLSDGKTVWQFLKKENEVNVSKYDPKEGFSIERIFRIYEEDMKVRLDKTETYKGRTTHKISLFPISDGTDYFRVEVWIDAQSQLPQRMRISNRDGTIVEYELKSYDTQPIPDSMFVFDSTKHPGVKVIDLR
ncbi:MAG: outer membrane lipoprotein carrier protein LolA [Bacteroidia bacterium]|nr:outer membrane lipoprotein carrier protein LolA [Bacteroidia bacterium]MDW8416532.1 outer membrane lipoprotein carrier protein LolA [Bacteroidia bacterium]